MSNLSSFETDLRAIQALNLQDSRAVMAGDIDTIISQWTEDFVVLPAAGPIVRGRVANAENAERGRDQLEASEPVEYTVEFEEIEVHGDYAYEWGVPTAAACDPAEAEIPLRTVES